jgi:hypothetical protein
LEQAVVVYLKLRNGEFGSTEEREAIAALEEELLQVIKDADAGEFDGNRFGRGECALFMYGPDADRLFGIIENLLKASAVASGGHAIKRYGENFESSSPDVRVTW